MGYTIRTARPEDADAAGQIAVTAWEPIYAGYVGQMGEEIHRTVTKGWRDAKIASVVNFFTPRPDRGAFVAEDDGVIVEFVTYFMDVNKCIGEVCNNAVAPNRQCEGIATALYDAVMRVFTENGMKAATVSTGADDAHAPARRAYEKAGFGNPVYSVRYYKTL